MTETRKWTLGAVAIGLVIALAGWFLLIAPKRAEVADIQASTEAQEQTNTQLQTDIEVLKQQHKDLPEKQAEFAALQTKIPNSADMANYIRSMQQLAAKAGVGFTSLAPSEPAPLGGTADPSGALPLDTLAAMNLEMAVSGDYFQIVKFMNSLETAPRYTLVTGYTIAEGEDTAEATSADSASSATSGEPELAATISARIYLVPTAEAAGTSSAPTTTTTAP
jgi:type IV pilus assembly protein PilO